MLEVNKWETLVEHATEIFESCAGAALVEELRSE